MNTLQTIVYLINVRREHMRDAGLAWQTKRSAESSIEHAKECDKAIEQVLRTGLEEQGRLPPGSLRNVYYSRTPSEALGFTLTFLHDGGSKSTHSVTVRPSFTDKDSIAIAVTGSPAMQTLVEQVVRDLMVRSV